MGKRRWILWQSLIAPGMERCIIGATDDGFELSGLILQAHDDVPYVVRYTIRVDQEWRTREVQVELENGGERGTRLTSDGHGGWTQDGGHRLAELEGCTDIDLEWSPSTNTLPIRRLSLVSGTTKAITAAWLRFPSLAVERLDQSYERLDDRRYRYRSGLFTADLVVDDDALALQYGMAWKAVATSGNLG